MGDIDDILADVTGDDVIPTETRDLRRLTRAWVNERASPELMPYPQDVMERVMNRIRRQVGRTFFFLSYFFFFFFFFFIFECCISISPRVFTWYSTSTDPLGEWRGWE